MFFQGTEIKLKPKLLVQDKKHFLANVSLNIESNSFKGKSIYLDNIVQHS